jgi:hypothetical protein
LARNGGDGLLSSSDCFSGVGVDVLPGLSISLAYNAMKKFEKKAQPRGVLFFMLIMGLAVSCLSGCKTAGGNEDENGSDLPWNTPQPWEGAPAIPGMDGMGQ